MCVWGGGGSGPFPSRPSRPSLVPLAASAAGAAIRLSGADHVTKRYGSRDWMVLITWLDSVDHGIDHVAGRY